jgi:hypothetical protein
MLGFAPLAAAPLASAGANLIAVAATLSATITFTISPGGAPGALIPLSATIPLTFTGAGLLTVEQALTATVTISYGGNPVLRLAGRPIRITAQADRFQLTAQADSHRLTPLPDRTHLQGAP